MGDRPSVVSNPTSPWASWRLRLCDGRPGADERDSVLGAGILLSDRLALTCAHVLPDQHARLRVEFPESRAIPTTTATVAEGGFHPPVSGDHGRWPNGDVALLELDPPRPQAVPVRLNLASPYPGRKLRMCGYPVRLDAGCWVEAEVAGTYGEAFMQLRPREPRDAVRPGFSGAAVIDAAGLDGHGGSTAQSLVLGMVVSRFKDLSQLPPEQRQYHTYMIPTKRIVQLMPWLDQYTSGPGPSDKSLLTNHSPASEPDAGLARELAEWLTGGCPDPRPAAMLVATKGEPARDNAVRQSLDGVDAALNAAGRGIEELSRELPKRLGLPDASQDELRDWLADGQGPPPALPNGGTQACPTVAVYGIDVASKPVKLIELLVRLRELGFRVLAVCQYDRGEVWRQAAGDLMNPMLRKTAKGLIRVLRDLEHEARHRPLLRVYDPVAEVVVQRADRLLELQGGQDPDRSMRDLQLLVTQLGGDIVRLRGALGRGGGSHGSGSGGRS